MSFTKKTNQSFTNMQNAIEGSESIYSKNGFSKTTCPYMIYDDKNKRLFF
jgi:hypothetical protein